MEWLYSHTRKVALRIAMDREYAGQRQRIKAAVECSSKGLLTPPIPVAVATALKEEKEKEETGRA